LSTAHNKKLKNNEYKNQKQKSRWADEIRNRSKSLWDSVR